MYTILNIRPERVQHYIESGGFRSVAEAPADGAGPDALCNDTTISGVMRFANGASDLWRATLDCRRPSQGSHVLYFFENGKEVFTPIPEGVNVTQILQGDVNGDTYTDFLVRLSSGEALLYRRSPEFQLLENPPLTINVEQRVLHQQIVGIIAGFFSKSGSVDLPGGALERILDSMRPVPGFSDCELSRRERYWRLVNEGYSRSYIEERVPECPAPEPDSTGPTAPPTLAALDFYLLEDLPISVLDWRWFGHPDQGLTMGFHELFSPVLNFNSGMSIGSLVTGSALCPPVRMTYPYYLRLEDPVQQPPPAATPITFEEPAPRPGRRGTL